MVLPLTKFDWKRFCDHYHIAYVESGPNTSKGNISVHCPWCASADGGEHLGLSLKGPQYGCWRNATHRGAHPARLVKALLNCTQKQADSIVAQQEHVLIDDFDKLLQNMKGAELETKKAAPEKWPKEARPLWHAAKGKTPAARYLEYLEERGFENPTRVAAHYALHYCLTGLYKQRVLIPFHDEEGALLGWTARSVRSDDPLRYRASEGLPDGVLCGYANAARQLAKAADTLVIVEGPFDYMKVDFYSNCVCVALLGVVVTEQKFTKLVTLARQAARIVALLDPDILLSNFNFADKLQEASGRKVHVGKLPEGVKDPGDLVKWQVQQLDLKWCKL